MYQERHLRRRSIRCGLPGVGISSWLTMCLRAYVSQLSARELALFALEQGVGSGPQALYPELESQLVAAAKGNFLFGASITCGAVSAAEFAELLCSTRVIVDNSIFLLMLA